MWLPISIHPFVKKVCLCHNISLATHVCNVYEPLYSFTSSNVDTRQVSSSYVYLLSHSCTIGNSFHHKMYLESIYRSHISVSQIPFFVLFPSTVNVTINYIRIYINTSIFFQFIGLKQIFEHKRISCENEYKVQLYSIDDAI